MRYSLIQVAESNEIVKAGGYKARGFWIQDYHGTLADAKQRARDIEEVNSYHAQIIVVKGLSGGTFNVLYIHESDICAI